jgi:hypothetical protein
MQGMKNDLKAKKEPKKIKHIVFLIITAIPIAVFTLWYVLNEEHENNFYTYAMLVILGIVVIGKLVDKIFSSSPYKDIKKYCENTADPAATMAQLEKTWNEGFNFGEGRMDKNFIISIRNQTGRIIELEKAVWAYIGQNIVTGKEDTLVTLNYYEKEERQKKPKEIDISVIFDMFVNLKPESIDAIFNYIKENRPDIVIGYSEEAERLYNDGDMEGLKELARKQRM